MPILLLHLSSFHQHPNNLIHILLCNLKNNKDNAENEIKVHTLKFLKQYRTDNLIDLIQKATRRGYSGVEWIDFWGVGGMNSNVIIKWAYEVIMEQKLDTVIEPYYNNINHRLGISIKRCYVNGKSKFLPMELHNTIYRNKLTKIEELNISPIDYSHFKKTNENPEYFVIKSERKSDTDIGMSINISENTSDNDSND